jgi:uncharacterized protein
MKMTLTAFTPVAALAGGAMIGLAAVLLMAVKGRAAGISGIVARLFPPYGDAEWAGRAAFVAGLIAAPLAWQLVMGGVPAQTIDAGFGLLMIAGLLVGFGSVWGNGCTSGHGVCGLARLSARSLVAVGVFMTTAIATVTITRHLI